MRKIISLRCHTRYSYNAAVEISNSFIHLSSQSLLPISFWSFLLTWPFHFLRLIHHALSSDSSTPHSIFLQSLSHLSSFTSLQSSSFFILFSSFSSMLFVHLSSLPFIPFYVLLLLINLSFLNTYSFSFQDRVIEGDSMSSIWILSERQNKTALWNLKSIQVSDLTLHTPRRYKDSMYAQCTYSERMPCSLVDQVSLFALRVANWQGKLHRIPTTILQVFNIL